MTDCIITLYGDNALNLKNDSEDMGMETDEYLCFVLEFCRQLPRYVLFAVAAGVPVRFYANCYVGESEGVQGGE